MSAPSDGHSHEPPTEPDPGVEQLVLLLAALLAAAAAAGAVTALLGAAGTAVSAVGAVITSGRGPVTVTGQTVDHRAEMIRVLTRLGIDRPTAGLVVDAFGGMPLPAGRAPGSVAEQQARDAAVWRARFLVAAARRLQEAIEEARRRARAGGEDVAAAQRDAAAAQLARERRHAEAHRRAEQRRMDGADRIDTAVTAHGPILTWWSVLDASTTPECRVAHGHLWSPADPPPIGLPGTGPHVSCRCQPRPASWALCPDRLTVTEALRRPSQHIHVGR